MSSTTSVKSLAALFESQAAKNENVKQNPRPTDQSVAKVQKQVFSKASSPDTSPPLKGKFFSENQSGFADLKKQQYSRKQIQSYLESQGIFQKVEQGTVSLTPYVKGIKNHGNMEYNKQVLADLKGQYGSIPLNKALGALGIDRHVFDSGEDYLTAEQVQKIEEVCKNAARFQTWLTPLEAAFGSVRIA